VKDHSESLFNAAEKVPLSWHFRVVPPGELGPDLRRLMRLRQRVPLPMKGSV
jgi:hypothetical protein